MKSRSLIASFNFAIQGILYAVKTQRNMRIHFVMGALVLILATLLSVDRLELLVLFLTVGLVITAEMLNTAMEEIVDLVTQKYHRLARHAKNVAAGAVLVTSIISLFVAYLIFVDRLLNFHPDLLRKSFVSPHLTVMALAVVLIITVGLKALTGNSEFFSGGMPSGHSAIAFSLATAIYFVGQGFVSLVGYLLALLVAQSRIEGEIHSFVEVVIGSLIGIFVTVLFFQLKG